jgi:hypothetical protein
MYSVIQLCVCEGCCTDGDVLQVVGGVWSMCHEMHTGADIVIDYHNSRTDIDDKKLIHH